MRDQTIWYQLPITTIREALVTDELGLTAKEAEIRLSKYGHNELE